ncbi:hypothetical protein PT974_10910 [Cladobotryum mycophilum]|uniref:Cyanovirin-N domain-containing protein n=1 Tax=Cladobotryum mycophilum TaxID=491253 RepID=A0ABR0SCN3_9HYPO
MLFKANVVLMALAALTQHVEAGRLYCANACESIGGPTGGGHACNNSHYWAIEDDNQDSKTCTSTGPSGSTFSGGLCGGVSRAETPRNWYNPWGQGIAGNCGGVNRQLSVWTSGSTLYLRTADGYQTSCDTGKNLNQGASESSGNISFGCEIALNW